jgi:O-antigen/teichoic acid export membrane protein
VRDDETSKRGEAESLTNDPAATQLEVPASRAERGVEQHLGKRVSWTLLDQVLSSFTNFALSVVVARAVDATSFGAFSVAFAVFSFTLGMSRALVCEPLVVRFSAAKPRAVAEAARAATGLAVVFGAIAGIVCLVAAPLLGGEFQRMLPALAIVLPGLLLQDTWRYAFFAAKRPASATANDFVWALLQFTAIGVLIGLGQGSTPAFILAWGGAAGGAALYGYVQLGVVPSPRSAWGWLREHRDLAPMLLADYILAMGAFNLALVVIGVVGTLADVGSLRAAHVLLGPLQLLFFGAASITLPEFARRLDRTQGALIGYAGGVSAVLGTVALVWTSLLLLVPDSWGELLLGDSWEGARTVLPASGLHMTGLAVGMGATFMLRALADGRSVLTGSSIQSPMVFILGVVGVVVGGALGAALGFAVAHWFGAGVWWLLVIRSVRRRKKAEAAAAATG